MLHLFREHPTLLLALGTANWLALVAFVGFALWKGDLRARLMATVVLLVLVGIALFVGDWALTSGSSSAKRIAETLSRSPW